MTRCFSTIVTFARWIIVAQVIQSSLKLKIYSNYLSQLTQNPFMCTNFLFSVLMTLFSLYFEFLYKMFRLFFQNLVDLIFVLFSVLFSLIGLIIYGKHRHSPNWSFAMTTIGSILTLVAGVCTCIQVCVQLRSGS